MQFLLCPRRAILWRNLQRPRGMNRARNSLHESFPRRAGDRGVGALRRGCRCGGWTTGASAGCDIGRYGAAAAAAERAACDVDRANGAGRVGRVRRRRRGGVGRIRQVARTHAAAIDRVGEPAGAVFTRILAPNVAAALRAVRTPRDGWRLGARTRRYRRHGLPTGGPYGGERPLPVRDVASCPLATAARLREGRRKES